MKKIVKILALLLCGQLSAQSQLNCGFNLAYERLFELDPFAKKRFAEITADGSSAAVQKPANTVYVIPVVFHILHQGGNENISDAQIQSAVNILNRDFRKLNADTSQIVTSFKSIAADCSMQFSLATLDENGNCTNGITRHYDTRTFWTTIQPSNYAYTWDPTKYLNVYVVKSLPNGTAGYTYLPGTVGGNMDAIVILHSYVGNIGTANNFSSRSLTHEVGHWFNLSHVWGNTNNPGVACGDDGVSDTPVTKGSSNCNLSQANCSPGVVENVQNYMDYSFCSRMFTQGQKNRMHNCINNTIGGRNNLWTYNNLVETGVENPVSGCAPKAEFFTSNTVTCVGNSLTFTDFSYNSPVTNWLWSSNLASGTSTVQNGTLTFSSPGSAQVKLKVSNANGTDSIIKQNVLVMAGPNSGSSNFSESFENGSFPNSLWQITNPAFGSTFQQTSLAAATGTNSMWVNSYFDNPSGVVAMFSPAYNFQMAVVAQLDFKYAYSRKSSQDNDMLKVSISTNCGSSWTQIYSKTGAALNTTGTLVTSAYTNPAPSHWVTESVNLLSYSGNPVVHFKFEFVPGSTATGNNIFIDDINMGIVTSLSRASDNLTDFTVFPNPFTDELQIKTNSSGKQTEVVLYSVEMKKLDVYTFSDAGKTLRIGGTKDLSPGIYFLKIVQDGKSTMVKVIKS